MGITAILCAVVFRVFALGLPGKLLSRLKEADPAPFLIYLETGRDVRFSSSAEDFSPDFVETPAPLLPEPKQALLPAFGDPEEVSVYYAAGVSPDTEQLLKTPLTWDLTQPQPTVLVLHTHSTESYTKAGETYEETARWRTLDEAYNMLSVGEQVVARLREWGINAIQDRQIHDYPSYNGSYVQARETIQEYLEAYPGIRLILDLHRDASEGQRGQLRTVAEVDGEASAQLMLVVGTNHDSYEENAGLALKLHAQLERMYPGITRPLQLRTQRFNQDLLPGALLVEVGAAGNTHSEALLAADALAAAVAALASGTR